MAMKFLFGGTLSRVPYAWIAVPIVLLQLVMPLITTWAPLFFARAFHADLANFSTYMMALVAVLGLLPIVLWVASIRRLRHVGLTVWLAFPILLRYAFGFVVGVLLVRSWQGGPSADPMVPLVLKSLLDGIYWYILILTGLLLLIPGRQPPASSEPAAAL